MDLSQRRLHHESNVYGFCLRGGGTDLNLRRNTDHPDQFTAVSLNPSRKRRTNTLN